MSVIDTFTGALSDVANGNVVGAATHAAANTAAGFALGSISSWVLDGTRDALRGVASAVGTTTAPNLDSTWFSSTYWRVAALAAMLTVPFLCAAALQALARSDPALLARAVFGYLPVSLIGVSLAAPLTMLLLAATDQMSAAVSTTGVTGGARFLGQAATSAADMAGISGGVFFAVIIGLFTIMAALALEVELLVREAAIYVVVLMLPLAFAAMVWPARRVWAARLVELLVSLILSKFVIVAVLSLAGAALGSSGNQLSTLLTAMALVIFATFAPWALMRILPFTEVAASAAGMMRHELPQMTASATRLGSHSVAGAELAMAIPARLRQQAQGVDSGTADRESSGSPGFSPASEGDEPMAQSSSAFNPNASEAGATSVGEESEADAPQRPVSPESSGAPTPAPPPSSETADLAQSDPGASTDGPPGPVKLPAFWNTGSALTDDLPELRLGPELLGGPFEVDHTTESPGNEEQE